MPKLRGKLQLEVLFSRTWTFPPLSKDFCQISELDNFRATYRAKILENTKIMNTVPETCLLLPKFSKTPSYQSRLPENHFLWILSKMSHHTQRAEFFGASTTHGEFERKLKNWDFERLLHRVLQFWFGILTRVRHLRVFVVF